MSNAIEFYTFSSALKISYIPPTFSDPNMAIVEKNGVLLLEFARVLPETKNSKVKKYDWKNGCVNFSFGLPDIKEFLDAINRLKQTGQMELDLIHKNQSNGNIKKLTIKNGRDQGTFGIMVYEGEKNVPIYIKSSDLRIMEKIIESSIIYLTGIPYRKPMINNGV